MSEDDTAEDVELCIGDETVESEDGIRLPWPPDLTGLPEDARAGPRRRPPTPPASELFWATTRMCRRLKQEMWTGDENPRFDEVDMAEIRENVHRILPPEEEGPQVYANLLMRAMFHHGDYEWSVSEADRFLHDAVRAMGLTPEEELPYKVRLPNDMWVVTVSEDGGPLHSGTEIPDGFVPVAWVTGKWDPGRAHSLRYIMYETLQGATGAHVDLIEEGDA